MSYKIKAMCDQKDVSVKSTHLLQLFQTVVSLTELKGSPLKIMVVEWLHGYKKNLTSLSWLIWLTDYYHHWYEYICAYYLMI